MAIRIRADGRIFCAALHPPAPGDAYMDDGVHYYLSVEKKLLVTEPYEAHMRRGEWWWRGQEPEDVEIDDFYRT